MFRSLTTRLQDLVVTGGGGYVEGNTKRPIANPEVTAEEYLTRAIAANYKVDQSKVMDALASYVIMVCTEGFKDSEVETATSGTMGNYKAYSSADIYLAPLDAAKYH